MRIDRLISLCPISVSIARLPASWPRWLWCVGLCAASGATALSTPNGSAAAQIGGRGSAAAAKEDAEADPRLVRTLRDGGLKFDVNKFGNCTLVYRLEDGRTQLVIVESETEQWGEMEIRSVWSIAYGSKARLSIAKLERLLKENGRVKSGAWHLSDGEKLLAVFSVKVAADCAAASLKTVAVGVAEKADEMEKVLMSGGDEF